MIDKAYLMFKALHHTQGWKLNAIEKDLKAQVNKKYSEEKTRNKWNGKINTFIEHLRENASMNDPILEGLYDYVWEHKDLYYNNKFEAESKDARHVTNNELFDMSWSVLTSEHTADKMFNPGNFDPQKNLSKIVQILSDPKNTYTYAQLKQIEINAPKRFEKLVASSSGRSILEPSSQVYFHKQNMTAAKLIGIFANHNVSHAFMNPLQIKLKLNENTEFTFDGYTVSKDSNNRIDELLDKNGQYISKNIAGFLAASVDAVKDPVLNFLNLNTATTGTAMLLARLGFDVDSIGLFLTQPIIKGVVDRYFIAKEDAYLSLDDAINRELSKYDKELIKSYKKTLINTNFTKEELANAITTNGRDVDFQIRALLLFQRLNKMTSQLGDMTFLTKFNSSNNGPNGSIANTLAQDARIDKMIQTFGTSKNAIFSLGDVQKVMNIPIIKQFYNGARIVSREMFKDNFIQYNPLFQTALSKLTNTVRGQLDEDTINKFTNDFILYCMTYGDNPVLKGNKEERHKYIREFVKEFEERASEIKDNELIKIIRKDFSNYKCPVNTLTARTGEYSVDTQEKIRAGWENLLKNPSTRDLGEKLFFYNMYRTGLSFSPKTFLHLASVDVKNNIKGYVETLRNINDLEDIGIDNFIEQFQRNHSNNGKVVTQFNPHSDVKVTKSKNRVAFDFNSDFQREPITLMETSSGPKFVNIIKYDGNLYKYVSQIANRVIYKKVGILGNTNNFLEYDANDAHITSEFSNNNISEETEDPVTENPTISSEDEGIYSSFEDWVDNSPIVAEVIPQVFSKEDMDTFADNTTKSTFDTILDKRVEEGKLSKELLDKIAELKKEENKIIC